jgi:hypothetical protein
MKCCHVLLLHPHKGMIYCIGREGREREKNLKEVAKQMNVIIPSEMDACPYVSKR